jgi:hypothetical protein
MTAEQIVRAAVDAAGQAGGIARFAAIGTDGRRQVVWGLGDTDASALRDAEQNLRESDCVSELHVEPITNEQREIIEAGDVSWPVSGAVQS